MQQRVITLALLTGIFFSLVALGASVSRWRLPDNQQGYAPKQPIAYSHRLHAGELKIDCLFCHSNAEQSRYAGIPSSDVCMKCHQFVTASFDVVQDEAKKAKEAQPPREPDVKASTELRVLYDSLGLNQNLEPKENAHPHSIPWVRVHNLPNYVYFDHSAHVTVGVACQDCHGQVETFERMHQAERLSMGWCIHCHRDATKNGIHGRPVHASIDCTTCHY